MSYQHKGQALNNGVIAHTPDAEGTPGLPVTPEDDGLHIIEPFKGDFEWWYFDVMDPLTGNFLKVVFHIGTSPLKTRVYPQLAISVNTKEGSGTFTRHFTFDQVENETHHCHIKAGDVFEIKAETGDLPTYQVTVRLPLFTCQLVFKGLVEGWKPLGDRIVHTLDDKKSEFGWTIPAPLASVKGEFTFNKESYPIKHANGYHDHNFVRVDRGHPLHLDELVSRWYWGKGYAGPYTVIFMDTWFRSSRTVSFMVAENKRIIHSSNNLVDCLISGHDRSPGTGYPRKITLRSKDETFPAEAEFTFRRILDRKDLLAGVIFPVKLLIRTFVAKPVYFGLEATLKLTIQGKTIEGSGNYETMIFRNRGMKEREPSR